MEYSRHFPKRIRRMLIPVLACALVLTLAACAAQQVPPEPQASQAPPPPQPRPAKIALVLGAGAAKGFAHIGVLKVLEGHNVPIHMIVGTSAGSLVGSLYAYGYDAFRLQSLAMSVDRSDVIDMTIPDIGFIKGEKLENFVNRTIRNTPIEKLRTRFYAVATDVSAGEEAVFATGNTGRAVRASCSIPGVFQPVKVASRTYVDGGIVSPVAVNAARGLGADVVIAVDISGGKSGAVPQGTIDAFLLAVDIMYANISAYQVAKADVVIRPKVGHIASSDLSRRHEAILEGEKAAMEALPAIDRILSRLRQEQRL